MELNLEHKDKLFFDVCNSVLRLEVKKGHLLWSISEISRDSEITRSLIYYYFGKEKNIILQESVSFMLSFMFGSATPIHVDIRKRVSVLLERVNEMPYLLIYFIQEKNKDTSYGEMIRTAEDQLLVHLQSHYPHLDKDQIFRIYILELGLITHQRATVEQISSTYKEML